MLSRIACFRAGGHTGRKPTCFYGLGVIARVRHRPVPSFVQRLVFAAHDRGLTRRHFILFATKANLLPAGVPSPGSRLQSGAARRDRRPALTRGRRSLSGSLLTFVANRLAESADPDDGATHHRLRCFARDPELELIAIKAQHEQPDRR
jgi:hypothetical protein